MGGAGRLAVLTCALAAAGPVEAAPAPAPAHTDCGAVPSATYIPGVDAYGRPVAPAETADQPPMDLNTVIVMPRVAVPGNPMVRDAQVVVDLKGQLARAPGCVPAPPSPRKR
jgi:hypothetical protein